LGGLVLWRSADQLESAQRHIHLGKLLCCCLQFAYFNRSAFSSLGKFLERLDPFLADWPADVPVAVEVRNKNWLVPELFDCLRRHRAVHVLADQVWMPMPLSLVQKMDVVTGPFAYVRLLGDRQAVDALTKTLDHIVIDRGEEVRNDALAIAALADKVPVLAYVNNHFAGYGPGTAEELRSAIAATMEPT
jgi:uncharacterized protein YecE (DUF72 family)